MIVKKKSGVLLAAARYEPQEFPVQQQRPAPALHAEELFSQASLKAQGESDIPLLSQAYRQILRPYTAGLTVSPQIPSLLALDFKLELNRLTETMALCMAESTAAAFAGGKEPQAAVSGAAAGVWQQVGRLENNLWRADSEMRSILALQAQKDYGAYLFFSEKGMNTCEHCGQHHGELFSLNELQGNHLLPPLQPGGN